MNDDLGEQNNSESLHGNENNEMTIIGLNEEEGEKLVETMSNASEILDSYIDTVFRACGLTRNSKQDKRSKSNKTDNIYQFEKK